MSKTIFEGQEAWDIIWAGVKALKSVGEEDGYDLSAIVDNVWSDEKQKKVLNITIYKKPTPKPKEPYKEGDWKEDATKDNPKN